MQEMNNGAAGKLALLVNKIKEKPKDNRADSVNIYLAYRCNLKMKHKKNIVVIS